MSDPQRMLLDTVESVGVLRQQQDVLRDDINAIAEQAADTAAGVQGLRGSVDGLAEAVARLQHSDGSPEAEQATEPDESKVVDWSSLEAEQAGEEWQRLVDWVGGWLVPTYGITVGQLRPCWALHPRAREELSWLRSTWHYAYRTGGVVPPTVAGDWHQRYLPGVIKALESEWQGPRGGRGVACDVGQHYDRATQQVFLLPERLRAADPSSAHLALSTPDRWLTSGEALQPAPTR